jgi:hypothetical protein
MFSFVLLILVVFSSMHVNVLPNSNSQLSLEERKNSQLITMNETN